MKIVFLIFSWVLYDLYEKNKKNIPEETIAAPRSKARMPHRIARGVCARVFERKGRVENLPEAGSFEAQMLRLTLRADASLI